MNARIAKNREVAAASVLTLLALALLFPCLSRADFTSVERSWAPPSVAQPHGGVQSSSPAVAVGSDGSAVAAWVTFSQLFVATRPPDGEFGAPQTLYTETAFDHSLGEPKIAIGDNGEASIVFNTLNYGGGTDDLLELHRPNSSTTFGSPTVLIDGESQDPQVTISPAGETIVVWTGSDGDSLRIQSRVKPSDGSFGAAKFLSPANREAYLPQLAVDSSGTATVVWQRDYRFVSPRYTIEAATRPAEGSFSSPVQISDGTAESFDPEIAASPDGVTVIVYRQSVPKAVFGDSTGSFGSPVLLSASSGQAPIVSADADGNFQAVWKTQNGSIFGAYRPAGGVFQSPTPITSSGLLPVLGVGDDGVFRIIFERVVTSGTQQEVWSVDEVSPGQFGVPRRISAAGDFAGDPRMALGPVGADVAGWRVDDDHWLPELIESGPGVLVERQGDGSGSVSSQPAGVDCGSMCLSYFPDGTQVNLNAQPTAHSEFLSWGGDCSGQSSCLLTVDSPKVVQADFLATEWPLDLAKSGNGSGEIEINPDDGYCGDACTRYFAVGESVTLTVVPTDSGDSLSRFAGWSGACSGTATSCTLTMNQAKSVGFRFVLIRPISVSTAGTGTGTITSSPTGISCGTECDTTMDFGSDVALTASPNADSRFVEWSSGPCGSSTEPVCEFQIESVNAPMTARFELNPRLAINKAGNGTGVVTSVGDSINCGTDCDGYFAPGDTVTLIADAAPGSQFDGWAGNCSGSGLCQVSMESDRSVTANFSAVPVQRYAVTVSKTGSGTGSVSSDPAGIACGGSCSASFESGTVVVLNTDAHAGSEFKRWTGGCSGSDPTCTIELDADSTVQARFEPTQVAPGKVSLGKKPKLRTSSRTAVFGFTSSRKGDTFECRLDRRVFSRCKSPIKLRRLSFGRHNFAVRAVRSGRRGSAIRFTWTVVRSSRYR